jgi:hypothetical protein
MLIHCVLQQYWIQVPMIKAADMTEPVFKDQEDVDMEGHQVEDTWHW